MALIEVRPDLCVQCGICCEVCPIKVLKMEENKGPIAVNPEFCNSCGHCVAVCPTKALNHERAPLTKQTEIHSSTKISAEQAALFLRSRRSSRRYKQEAVPHEQLAKLVDMARFAPTASNSQNISYMVIEQRQILREVVELTVQWMEAKVATPPFHKSMPLHIRAWRQGKEDTVLRNAPHLILAMAPKGFAKGRENTISALSYLELFAPALGLGSCWAGILEMCIFDGYAPLLALFPVPEGNVITGAVMAGYPQYTFRRLPDRDPLSVIYV